MNKEELQIKIESISNNSEYFRISATHPLEIYVGKNENGNPTLRFNGNFKPIKIIGNSLLEIKQVKTSTYNSILFSFTGRDNSALFYTFCDDIVNSTINSTQENGYRDIANRYNQWKKMFYSGSKILEEKQIVGLIGELLFLRDYCIAQYGENVAIMGWSGPEPTHKDFSFDKKWFEVKTVNSNRNAVTISSVEQLDSEYPGKLVVYSLEKMSASFDGLMLNKLITSIMSILTDDQSKDLFVEKLKLVGYSYNEVYDNYVYNLLNETIYDVKENFPRLLYKNLPLGIGKISYEILLSHIEEFKE